MKQVGTLDWFVPRWVFEGDRPSNTVLAERLIPDMLGKLVALYEHIVYRQGVIWNLDPFDQWSVEPGKVWPSASSRNVKIRQSPRSNTIVRGTT